MRMNSWCSKALFGLLLGIGALGVGPSARASDGFVLELTVASQPLEKVFDDVERAHRLGATHFNIPFLVCQHDKASSAVYWCGGDNVFEADPATAEEAKAYKARVELIGRELRARGFTVGILPFQLSKDREWRGFFEPADFAAWGASYVSYLREMAEIAARIGASDFVVGTELNKIFVHPDGAQQKLRSQFWRQTLGEFRRTLGSATRVFVVANWDQYDLIPFWDASDYLGLSAYYPLASSANDDTSVEALTKRWREWAKKLLAVSRKFGKPLYFSEVGYASVKNAAREPWGWFGELDMALQARLFTAFGNVWGATKGADLVYRNALARFQVWALTVLDKPLDDGGFVVIGKPAESAISEIFDRRAGRAPRATVPVVFTLDDLPAWFMGDEAERVAHYQAMRRVLERHGITRPVLFVNGAGIKSAAEWRVLREWQAAGARFANHTATHLARSSTTLDAFLADVDAGASVLGEQLPDWGRPLAFFRYPSLDFGSDAASKRETCEAVRRRGYEIMPVSFDSRDWSWGETYHEASGPTLAARSHSVDAQAVAERAFEVISNGFEQAAAKLSREPLKGSALIYLMHSTRFTRDYLDHVLTMLERKGARWVAADDDTLKGYRAGPDCLPACIANGDCN